MTVGFSRLAKRAVLAAALLFLAGCDHADYAPTNDVRYQPWGGLVQVVSRPPERYIELGVITAHGTLNSSREALIQLLKDRAAGLGANAIVVQGDRQPTGSRNILMVPEYNMSAIAIRTVR